MAPVVAIHEVLSGEMVIHEVLSGEMDKFCNFRSHVTFEIPFFNFKKMLVSFIPQTLECFFGS